MLAEARRSADGGFFREAASLAESWVADHPDDAEGWQIAALTRLALGDTDRAEEFLQRAVALRPQTATLRANLGEVLRRLGRLGPAKYQLEAAVRLDPQHAVAHLNLALVHAAHSHRGAAIAAARRAVEIDPDEPRARLTLGTMLLTKSLAEEALPHLERVTAMEPGNLGARYHLERARRMLCDWSHWPEEGCDIVRCSANGRGESGEGGIPPFFAYEYPVPNDLRLRCAQNYADRIIGRSAPAMAFAPTDAADGERLRIGYLSSDFHDHPTMHLAAGLFSAHDRRRFEVWGYSMGDPDDSDYGRQARLTVDHFVDVRQSSSEQLLARIRSDGIQILVDMKGFTFGARPDVLVRRPAPVQVQFLGYPGTMGRGLVDYLISDRTVTPSGSELWYGEHLALMPGSYQINDGRQVIGDAPSRAECGLPESAFVFACFNAMYKFDPETFGVWMRILDRVPGSVLWLLAGKNPGAAANLRSRAEQRGVPPERLIFAPFAPKAAHLGRLANADLVLDTRYVNAHTGASDALWAGVPVLTVCGDSFPSRVASSLLHAVGLPELCTDTIQDYETMALELATDRVRLARLRSRLAENRLRGALFDTARWVKNLEAAFEIMWTRHLDLGAPGSFSVLEQGHPPTAAAGPSGARPS